VVANATIEAVKQQINGFKQNGTQIQHVLPPIKFLLAKKQKKINNIAFIPYQIKAGGIHFLI
jgi:hypothetical protein